MVLILSRSIKASICRNVRGNYLVEWKEGEHIRSMWCAEHELRFL